MKYQNPVLRGMYPDPSVCSAEGKYYMVCSSFSYFPAVPLFESDDMVNWKQIGHCLTRKSQVNLTGASADGGIYAPTIRYHKGCFYMVTTNVNQGINFYIFTYDIYGEWSEPIHVEQDGIDPSLYFEGNRAWFISNGFDEHSKKACIHMCEIDIATGKKLGERKPLWFGTGGRYIEAPHLYKIGSYYYLLDAEGGTEYGHMVNYARSKNMWGPYEPFPENPVLTNRNLGGYMLQGAGHGDIVEDRKGNWWFLHLAFRQQDQWVPYHHLGRETCLVPVQWKEDWFYMGDGTASLSYDVTDLVCEPQKLSFQKNFSNLYLGKDWCFLREFRKENYDFQPKSLRLRGTLDTLSGLDFPTCAALRQSEFRELISVMVNGNCAEAGITMFLNEKHHYDFYLEDGNYVVLRLQIGNVVHEAFRKKIKDSVKLIIHADEIKYEFMVMEGQLEINVGNADTRYLTSEVAGGFTGVMIGLYAVDEQYRYANFRELCLIHEE